MNLEKKLKIIAGAGLALFLVGSIYLVSANPKKYILSTAIKSTIGCAVLYDLNRRLK